MTDEKQDVKPAAPDFAYLNKLLREGQIAEVEKEVAAFAAEAFHLLPGRMLMTRLHMAKGAHDEAADIVAEHVDRHVERNPFAWLLGIQSLCKAGRIEAARDTFLRGLKNAHAAQPNLEQGAVDTILDHVRDRKEQLSFLKKALDHAPEATKVKLRLASRHMLLGNPKEAADLLSEVEAIEELPVYAERMKSMIAPLIEDYTQGFERLRKEDSSAVDNSQRLRRMSRFATAARRYTDGYVAAQEALDKFPSDWLVLFRLCRTVMNVDQQSEVMAQLRAHRANNETDLSWDLQYAILCLQAGDQETAKSLLPPILEEPAIGWIARLLDGVLQVLADTPVDFAPFSPESEISVVRHPEAKATAIVFGNNTGGMEAMHLAYVDAALSSLPINRIYLRDLSGLMFQRGLPEAGPTADALSDHLQALIQDMGDGPVFTMGNSFATYAAGRVAARIDIDHVISLAGIFSPEDMQGDDHVLSSQALAELKNAGDVTDMLPALAAKEGLKVTHIYGADFGPDVTRANKLAGLDNFTVIALDGVSHHYTGMESIIRGLLPKLIQDIIDAG